MRNRSNMVGDIFGELTVIGRSGSQGGNSTWKCLCSCGRETVVQRSNLRSKSVSSCGNCKPSARKTHGRTGDPIYTIWSAMKQRCYYKKNKSYSRYGGRGITVCDRWRNSFEAFLSDMGERPYRGTIERVDVEGDYTPENCKWANLIEQANNKTNNVLLTIAGETFSIAQWSVISGRKYGTIYNRKKRGWSDTDSVFKDPTYNYKKK